MSSFDRIKNVAKGKVSKIVGDVERNNPEAVFESAVNRRLLSLAEHKEIAATLVVQRNRVTAELEKLERELGQLMKALHGAVHEGDDDTALVLEFRRQEVMKLTETKTAELLKVTGQVEETKVALNKFREDTKALKREKITVAAQHAVAEARIEINDTIYGMSESTTAQALEQVRENVDSLKRKAHPGYLDEEGNSIQGRAEAMGRKAKENSARAQLEQMKRDLAARKNPSDDEDEDG